jgi:tRNA(fMet)-specific endonuclease VapC
LSEVIKGRDEAIAREALAYLSTNGRFTFSIITRYEILRGLKTRGAARQLAQFEAQCHASEILPLTDDIVIRAADIYASLHRAGRLIGDADTLIAATALVHGLTLVTNNTGHYRRVPGLTVISWRDTA